MPTWGEILKELQQLHTSQQQLPPGVSAFDAVRRKYIQALAKHTGRNVILYASKWTQGGVEPEVISITPEDVQGFMEVVHGLTGDTLDLVVHSPGGSAEATESIVTYLRSKFRDIRVLIPHAAMSAATMLACAADRLIMGKHSFIGPIDPQLILQTELGRKPVPAAAILEQFKRAQEECRDPARLPSWIPMLRQYGPALIVQCQLAMELAKSLVADWLACYMFASDPNPKDKATKAADALADHATFRSHGRFIARDQAKTLGLVVDNLEADEDLQDAVLSIFHASTHTFNVTLAVKLIENHHGKAFIKQQGTLVPQGPGGGGPGAPPAAPPGP
jgi:hypothetical protein